MSHVERIGNRISVPLQPDEQGYIGRECPNKKCLGYFKVKPGTGVKGPAPCHCPYCGHTGDQNTFFTPEQIEYARSVAIRRVTDAFRADLKDLEFDHRPVGPFGIGISMKVQHGPPHPISHYREKQLETEVVCERCTLRFAIYGVFGWCPDCGAHNSLGILVKNLELARKQLKLALSAIDDELAAHLRGDALENIVSAFDGFGREACAKRSASVSFQNLAGARRKIRRDFGFDFADGLGDDDWGTACRIFQKRHLLAHKMGVVDAEYIQKTKDLTAVVGRRVVITEADVAKAIVIVEKLGQQLFNGLLLTTKTATD